MVVRYHPASLARKPTNTPENPPTSLVQSHNEWDPLEEVIVGRLDGAMVFPHAEINRPTVSEEWSEVVERICGRRQPPLQYPPERLQAAQRDLDGFIRVLTDAGVRVRRPDRTPPEAPYKTPGWEMPQGVTCPTHPPDSPAHSRRWRPARPQAAQHPRRRRGTDDDGAEPHAPPTQRARPTIDVEEPLEQVRPRGAGDTDPRRSLRQTRVRFEPGRRPRHNLLPPARVRREDAMVADLMFPERRDQRDEPRHQLGGREPEGGRAIRPRARRPYSGSIWRMEGDLMATPALPGHGERLAGAFWQRACVGTGVALRWAS